MLERVSSQGNPPTDSGNGNCEQPPWRTPGSFLSMRMRVKLDHSLTPYTKVNCRWVKGLNKRTDTMKLLRKKAKKTHFDIKCSKFFFDPRFRIRTNKTKINKWDTINVFKKHLCSK